MDRGGGGGGGGKGGRSGGLFFSVTFFSARGAVTRSRAPSSREKAPVASVGDPSGDPLDSSCI